MEGQAKEEHGATPLALEDGMPETQGRREEPGEGAGTTRANHWALGRNAVGVETHRGITVVLVVTCPTLSVFHETVGAIIC